MKVEILPLRRSREFLVSTSEVGQPVDVDFLSIQVSRSTTVDLVNVTASTQVNPKGTGVYVLVLPRQPGDDDDDDDGDDDDPPDILLVSVKHPDVVDHFGFATTRERGDDDDDSYEGEGEGEDDDKGEGDGGDDPDAVEVEDDDEGDDGDDNDGRRG